jgi:phage shock protein A
MHLQATQAAQQAKAAVQQNSNALQQKLAERQKLLSQLDQAKMQEQLNTAMTSLSQAVGQDVPTFDEVRAKIEAQYAKALGTAELGGANMDARMLEIEQASVNFEAHQRIEMLRTQMGLPAGDAGAPQALTGQPQTAGELGTASEVAAVEDVVPAEAVAEPVAEPSSPSDSKSS